MQPNAAKVYHHSSGKALAMWLNQKCMWARTPPTSTRRPLPFKSAWAPTHRLGPGCRRPRRARCTAAPATGSCAPRWRAGGSAPVGWSSQISVSACRRACEVGRFGAAAAPPTWGLICAAFLGSTMRTCSKCLRVCCRSFCSARTYFFSRLKTWRGWRETAGHVDALRLEYDSVWFPIGNCQHHGQSFVWKDLAFVSEKVLLATEGDSVLNFQTLGEGEQIPMCLFV